MLDIDDFKQINDTYGHLQGDKVLRMVGRVLKDESRGVDEPARYGGEEFAVVLPETGIEGALDLAERVRARIESEQVPRAGGAGHRERHRERRGGLHARLGQRGRGIDSCRGRGAVRGKARRQEPGCQRRSAAGRS